MSASQGWALQQAVYARLVAQLAGQGPGAADVPVYDHVLLDPPRVHVRIDGFDVIRRPWKADKTRHAFMVHVFDRPTTESGAARGLKTARLLDQTIVAALRGWNPSVAGASKIRHEGGETAPDEDGLTTHAVSRFSVLVGA